MQMLTLHKPNHLARRTTRGHFYRNANFSEKITIGLNVQGLFASLENPSEAVSITVVECDQMLVDMLVRAGIITDFDATSALSAAHEWSVIDYIRVFKQLNVDSCDAFAALIDSVRIGNITFEQAIVAANFLYATGSTLAESMRLVKGWCRSTHAEKCA